MLERLARLRAHFAPFIDRRAWVVLAVCAGGELAIDPVFIKTILTWVLPFGIFGGFAVILSRYLLPQINLTQHIEEALRGNVASGQVVKGFLQFFGVLIFAIAFWGRP